MNDFDKIRVLWIDDREEADGYPESQITPMEYQKWFEIVHPFSHDDALSFRSVNEFTPVITKFWFDGDSSVLPAEIIATDYNLSKLGGTGVGSQNSKDVENQIAQDDDNNSQKNESYETSSMTHREVNFEGLLISLFYGTLTFKHPAAIVPMTRYLSKMPTEAETLHTLVEPFLGVDFQYIGLEDRRWESILKEGTKHLRNRIADLYKSGDIVVSLTDLIALSEGHEGHNVLTILSPHASKSLPLEGLFIDISDSDKTSHIQEWSNRLLSSHITQDQYILANQLHKTIWSTYNNDLLINEHAEFSQLHLTDQSNPKYEKLKNTYQLSKTDRGDSAFQCMGSQCIDIKNAKIPSKTKKEDKSTRRWAALFLIMRLLKRILVFMNEIPMDRTTREGGIKTQSLHPSFEEDDILLLLYPVPTSPFPLPWHIEDAKARGNKKGAWHKWMKDNLGLTPKDILDGSGLTIGERQVLQGIVIAKDVEFGDSPKARLERWKSYEPARLFMFGSTNIDKSHKYE